LLLELLALPTLPTVIIRIKKTFNSERIREERGRGGRETERGGRGRVIDI
jgi:hypothetical protein